MNSENNHTGSDGTANGNRLPNRSNGKSTDRDGKGRFQRGCAPGPGNPRARQVGEYQRAVREAVTCEDIAAIFKMLVRKARSGDKAAAEMVLNRSIGKPIARIESQMDINQQPNLPPRLDELEEFEAIRRGALADESTHNGDSNS